MPYKDVAARRAASRRHYKRNADAMKNRAAVHREAARERNRVHIAAIKAGSACADCSMAYPPYVMQFDHLGEDKDRAIAEMAAAPCSLKRIDEEIAKCEVVCANCHAVRTWQRRQLPAATV